MQTIKFLLGQTVQDTGLLELTFIDWIYFKLKIGQVQVLGPVVLMLK